VPLLHQLRVFYKVGLEELRSTGWTKNTGLFLRSDNFETYDRRACNTSKVSEFCLQ